MQVIQPAVAGTLESSDIQIRILPNPGGGLELQLQSIVLAQFGDAIRATIRAVLEDFGVTDACVDAVDKGALDWVIRARMQAACCRACGVGFDWKGEDAP